MPRIPDWKRTEYKGMKQGDRVIATGKKSGIRRSGILESLSMINREAYIRFDEPVTTNIGRIRGTYYPVTQLEPNPKGEIINA